ncbi:MAG: F0F1 ATP synthase subunit delta [Patescibacteria group bacterium]
MSLAHYYATIIAPLREGGKIDEVIAYMKKRGHESLLPQVARIIERTPDSDQIQLTVASEKEGKKFVPHALHLGEGTVETKVDPSIVGGYVVRKGGSLIDASYRRTLVSLYQKITQQ